MGYYLCDCCGTKIREDKWEDHCKTKKHIKFQENSIYAKELFNSGYGVKRPLLLTFIPRVKFNKKVSWRMK